MTPNGQLASQLKLPEHVVNEAMEWLVLSWSGETEPDFDQALKDWLGENQENQRAWAQLTRISGQFEQVPRHIAADSLRTANKVGSRRRFLQVLGALAFGMILSPYIMRQRFVQASFADLQTRTGEIRSITLEDGTQLVMNTATAVDLVFSASERRIKLVSGEIQITTAKDKLGRPFWVESAHGSIHPIGTQFTVKLNDETTLIHVQEGAVNIQTLEKQQLQISAGQTTGFNTNQLLPGEKYQIPEWVHGKLKAEQLELKDFFFELERYRTGFIRVHPDISSLKISGRFDLRNTDRTLSLVEDALPIKVENLSPYWVNITPE